MLEWRSDVVHAWRRLRLAPGTTLFSIATLALGIGATTAIYSVVYTAVLRPPDVPNVDRVANLYHMDPRHFGSRSMFSLSRADYADYRRVQTSFEFLAAWTRLRLPLANGDTNEMVDAEAVDGQYFSVVAIHPALGRVIQPADDRVGAPPVIVLSDALWRQRFAADPAIVGRIVTLARSTFEIIGVTPPSFRGVDMPNVVPTAAWIPLAAAPGIDPGDLTDRDRRTIAVKGRLKPGVSMRAAQAEFRAIANRLDAAVPIGVNIEPQARKPYNTSRPWFLMPWANVKMHESVDPIVRPLVATILVAVGLVLLIACTNVANLMVARGAVRQHERAVRLALGASRWRLIREQLVEAALVALAGAAAAFVVARVLMFRVLSGELRPTPGTSLQFSPEMNIPVALVAVASAALALIVFGLVPAIHGTRASVRQALASDGHNAPLPRWRGRRWLIACQVAVSAGLVSVAVLCAQQVVALARHDAGIDLERLAIMRVGMDRARYDETQGRWAFQQLLDAARRLSGVESASLSSGFPIELGGPGGLVAVSPDQFTGGFYSFMVSTPEVFSTWGVALLQGRGFDERDTASSEPVVVITERLARSLFARDSVLGKHIVLRWRSFNNESPAPVQTVTVIGIVADADAGDVGNRGGGLLYLPWTQQYQPAMVITVRTARDPATLVDALKRLVNRVDPGIAIMEAERASILGGAHNLVLKVGATAAGSLGLLALVLALAGLYGVLSELVLRRTREMGIRMALGADTRRLVRMVLVDGIRPVLNGLAIGLGCGVVLRFAFRPLFIRILPAFDPLIIALVPIVFVAAALMATYLPARRAARVDPNVALRHL